MSTPENTGQTTINDLFAPESPTAPPAAPPEATPAPTQPQPVVTATPNPAPAEPPPVQPQGQLEPPPVHQVPVAVLQEERRRRQEAERMAFQYQQLIEAHQRQQPQPQPIDPVVEPERAFAALQQQNVAMQHQMHNMAVHTRANTSEMIVRQQLGDAAVDRAVQAAHAANMGDYFMSRPNPYGELMHWHKSQEVTREIGTDPAAFRAKIAAEERAKVLAELKAGANPPRNLPPSLSSATNAAGNQGDVVPETKDFFRQMMTRPQRK